MDASTVPGVPSSEAFAPERVSRPPGFRWNDARWLEMVEVQTLCFHIISEFLYKSKISKREENSYYSSKTENIMNWLKSIIKNNLGEKIPPKYCM